MSIYGVAWALDRVRGVSVGAKIVLISLAEFANEQDVTWVSREPCGVFAARVEWVFQGVGGVWGPDSRGTLRVVCVRIVLAHG